MLTAERRRSILQTLQREGKVLASELSKTLQVSEDTIRRDLNDLAAGTRSEGRHRPGRRPAHPTGSGHHFGWGYHNPTSSPAPAT